MGGPRKQRPEGEADAEPAAAVNDRQVAPHTNPDAALAAAVLQIAWNDLRAPVSSASNSAAVVKPHERAEAIAFCTARDGNWAKSREAWCDMAGIDPVAFRERALLRIGRGTRA